MKRRRLKRNPKKYASFSPRSEAERVFATLERKAEINTFEAHDEAILTPESLEFLAELPGISPKGRGIWTWVNKVITAQPTWWRIWIQSTPNRELIHDPAFSTKRKGFRYVVWVTITDYAGGEDTPSRGRGRRIKGEDRRMGPSKKYGAFFEAYPTLKSAQDGAKYLHRYLEKEVLKNVHNSHWSYEGFRLNWKQQEEGFGQKFTPFRRRQLETTRDSILNKLMKKMITIKLDPQKGDWNTAWESLPWVEKIK